MELRELTDQEKLRLDEETYSAWGGGFSREVYLQRQQLLRAQPWAAEAQRNWGMVNDAGQVVTSCEVITMPSAWRGEAGICIAIASVFTPEAERSQGLAAKMLLQLKERLPTKNLQACVGFSEIGDDFYARFGGGSRSADDLILAPRTYPPRADIEFLSDVEEIVESLPDTDTPPQLEVKLKRDQLRYHLTWQRFYAEAFGSPWLPHVGVRLGVATIYWYADARTRMLQILHCNAPDQEEAAELLATAQGIAQGAGLRGVQIWSTELTQPQMAALEGNLQTRPDSIPMILPLAEGMTSKDWNWISRAHWI